MPRFAVLFQKGSLFRTTPLWRICLATVPVVTWLLLPLVSADASPPDGNSPANNERPNVLVILADDMGYGDTGCFNPDSKCPTPHIDSLARDGMRFTDAHSAGAWCTPSRYGLLTGRYAFRTSLAWQSQPVIADGVATVADVLRQSGYQTAMVGKWHLGFVGGSAVDYDAEVRGGPCDRGFSTFFGLPASLDIPDYFWIVNRRVPNPPTLPIEGSDSENWSPVQGRFWRGGLRGKDFEMDQVLDRIGEESVKQISKLSTSDDPFFLYVPLTSPHTPWLPAEAFASADGAGLYSQFVAHTDAIVGRLLDCLEEHKIAENTVVLFTSDNGPVWYPYDTERFGHDAVAGLRGIKGDVWEGGHRVPFIVRWPGQIPADSLYEGLFSFVDIHSTLANLVSAKEAETALDSIDFSRVLLGDVDLAPRNELISFQEPIALRAGKWKMITRRGSAGFLSHHPRQGTAFRNRKQDELNPTSGSAMSPEGQLYDLSTDRDESDNLWEERPAVVKRMRDRLQQLAR